jgi:hypothetical protein
MTLVREPDAGNPPVRFDEREVETEYGMWIMRHRRGNPDTELCRSLTHRATSRLYLIFPWQEHCRLIIPAGANGKCSLNGLASGSVVRPRAEPARIDCGRSNVPETS